MRDVKGQKGQKVNAKGEEMSDRREKEDVKKGFGVISDKMRVLSLVCVSSQGGKLTLCYFNFEMNK